MTPEGVEKEASVQRTMRQPVISHLRSHPVTAHIRAAAGVYRSSSRRASRIARAAGEPA